MEKTKVCKNCGRVLPLTQFWGLKDKNWRPGYGMTKYEKKYDICKECIYAVVNEDDPYTFQWLLKDFDMPFIERDWNNIRRKHPHGHNLGRYISLMRLFSYYCLTYKDGERINGLNRI